MIEYATRSLLQGFASQVGPTAQASLRQRAADRLPAGSTFLSHSSQDADLLVGAIRVLEGHGAAVYIDKKDAALPPYTTKDTATGLKGRIRESRNFVLLASKNSRDSRWVPWELGIADQSKGMGRVAIFPAVEEQHERSWTNWEYLGIYDRIVWGDLKGQQTQIWMVLDETAHTAVPLQDWLARP